MSGGGVRRRSTKNQHHYSLWLASSTWVVIKSLVAIMITLLNIDREMGYCVDILKGFPSHFLMAIN